MRKIPPPRGVPALFLHRKTSAKGEPTHPLTRVLLDAGIDYHQMLRVGLERLPGLASGSSWTRFRAGHPTGWIGAGRNRTQVTVELADYQRAIAELQDSWRNSIARGAAPDRDDGRDYRPLLRGDGQPVRGAWTWEDRFGGAGVKLTGRLITRQTLEPEAGAAPVRSGPVVVAKEWITEQAGCAGWVAYNLPANAPVLLGDEAIAAATANGMIEGVSDV